MITVYPYNSLGHANFGWLDAHYHFSFSRYINPERTGFGVLRVINDDTVKAGAGFDTHPHKDMEIITYVRKGAITHRDSQGNEGRTAAGDVQVMSAGSGIFHSEYNLESEDTTLFQIWIEPREKGITPRWDSHAFPKEPVKDALPLLVSGDGDAPLHIHQDARIYAGRLAAHHTIKHPITAQAYLLVSEGAVMVNDQYLRKGDGAEITDLSEVVITATYESEVLVIDVPHQPTHH
ncbi:MAG: pirin family protein [Rickettsiales bacterium]|nr:pirin family protein [Rickettsiales bacterium]